MICENCGKEYGEQTSHCPNCSAEKEKDFDILTEYEVFDEIQQDELEPEVQDEEYEAEDNTEAEDAEERKAPDVKKVTAKPPRRRSKKKPAVKEKESRSERQAKRFVVCIVSFMAVLLGAVSYIGLTTDTFEPKESSVPAALTGLSTQEEVELEGYLAGLYPLAHTGFDAKKISVSELLELMRVGAEDGLFASAGKSCSLITDTPDPAGRFKVAPEIEDEYTQDESYGEAETEAEAYEYYKVPVGDIDSILQSLGVEPDHTVNDDNMYFYRDSYYFAPLAQKSDTAEALAFDITQSKKVQGGYYVMCSALTSAGAEVRKVYVQAEKLADEAGAYTWRVTRISHEPLFDSLGIMTNSDTSVHRYEIKRKIIEAETSDGKLYCRYVIEYPYFEGTGVGEQAVNTLYQSLIAAYELEAQSADSNYKKYKKGGYDEADLPRQIYVRGEVTYNKEKYISVVNEIALSSAALIPEENTSGEDYGYGYTVEEETAPTDILPVRSFEGYIFDMVTGDFVSKDTILGKDYLKIAELLYRIDGGYDYSALLSGEEEAVPVPADEQGIGLTIYEGAAVLCEDGFAFYGTDEIGVGKRTLIPYTLEGVFSEVF